MGINWLSQLALVIIGAVAGSAATMMIRPLVHRFRALREHRRPYTERMLRVIVKETIAAQIWHKTPMVFRESIEYVRRNWSQFDPWQLRDQLAAPDETCESIPIVDLVSRPHAHAGRKIAIIGHLVGENQLGPDFGPLQTRILQVVSVLPGGETSMAYCRCTVPTATVFEKDDHLIMLAGVVLAGGALTMRNRTLRDGVYILATFAASIPKVSSDPGS